MCTERTRRQRGVSLIELILTMVVLGIAAAGVLLVLNMSAKNTADPVRRKQGMLIAEGLLEEVELARMTWCDPADAHVLTATSSTVGAALTDCASASTAEAMGPELVAGNTRPYDNVNDYSGLTTTVDASGTAFGGGTGSMSGYSATVAITSSDKLGPAAAIIDGTAAPLGLLRITVTVTYSPGESVVLEGYRARYAPNTVP